MCAADVTALSLVTNKSHDDVCHTVIPYVARALSNQCVSYQRMPLTRDYVDWVINDSDQLTVALDQVGDTCIILLATRGADTVACADRLVAIGSELRRDYDAHTVFWNGSEHAIPAEDFLNPDAPSSTAATSRQRIFPRRVERPPVAARAARARYDVQVDQWMFNALRASFYQVGCGTSEQSETENRRAKTVPLRLAAWALSISTACIAAPLAIPLLVHNLVRGEDVRSGAMSLGVAGLYASMAHTGLVPGLAALL